MRTGCSDGWFTGAVARGFSARAPASRLRSSGAGTRAGWPSLPWSARTVASSTGASTSSRSATLTDATGMGRRCAGSMNVPVSPMRAVGQ